MSGPAANFSGDIPGEYDRGLGPVLFDEFAGDMARLATAYAPRRILETAAGTGIVTRRLHDAMPSATLTATDLNAPMLAIAAAKFSGREAVRFEPANAIDLPYADASFDAVICQFGVMFFPDKAKGFAEAFRVLAPGGRHIFSVWDSHRRNLAGRLPDGVIRAAFPVDPPRFYEVPFHYHAIDPVKDALQEAGFIDLHVHVAVHDKAIPDIAVFARGLVYGNPLIEEVRARAGDPDALVAAIEAALRAACPTGRIPLQTIFFDAGKP